MEAKRKANAAEAKKKANADEAKRKANKLQLQALRSKYQSNINRLKLPKSVAAPFLTRVTKSNKTIENLKKTLANATKAKPKKQNVRLAAERSATTVKKVLTNMERRSLISFINQRRQKLTNPRATMYKLRVAKAETGKDIAKIRKNVEDEIINRSL